MRVKVREYTQNDIDSMIKIWNEVVEEGIAFPQEECLDREKGIKFFEEQSFCGVAENQKGEIVGMYILHPNNVGRCAHICNASYAVAGEIRGKGVGEKLVKNSLKTGKKLGFKIMQFNAVVRTNVYARCLYEKIGFKQLGVIYKGFRMKDGHYEDICPYYTEL